ncbi:unnamed protein product, partial [Brenthis ino]
MKSCVFFLFCFCVQLVHLQGSGSGSNGNLRLCLVAERGPLKRAETFCPILDEEKSGVECVLGADQLDCLRRISKGTVDFGVFSPEDLVAAQWANIDVLVTNEIRIRRRPFERSIVSVINRRIIPEHESSLDGVLRNTTLCHPGVDPFTIRPLSDTLSGYLESLVLPRNCDPNLTLLENRLKGLASFFYQACKAGPWVPFRYGDAILKNKYKSLCAACASNCLMEDKYWGPIGNLQCLSDGAGDAMWGDLDDVKAYFGVNVKSNTNALQSDSFAYLCRDGTTQPLNTTDPCVWIHRPWPVVIAKRKAAAAVSTLVTSFAESDFFDSHWRGALAFLLEMRQVSTPLRPPKNPLDYLASAQGFREAYSQSGCDPPRHITLCTTSLLEKNKCEWLSEAGAVYGVNPPLQCVLRNNMRQCFSAAQNGDCDVTVADAEWLVEGTRDYNLQPLLFEVTPPTKTKMNTVMAYVRYDDKLNKMADLRGKRASFPRYDGIAWHSMLDYIKKNENIDCFEVLTDYFSEICAPGMENLNISANIIEKFTINCYKENGNVTSGEVGALRALVEGRSDVAFISMKTAFLYENNLITESWAANTIKIAPICPKENQEHCVISWSHLGHIYASKNLTKMRRDEIITVFTRLDKLFGKQMQNGQKNRRYTIMDAMFRMYGPFNHQIDVLFNNNTESLSTIEGLSVYPYSTMPFNFELTFNVTSDSCQVKDVLRASAFKMAPTALLLSMIIYVLCR